MANLTPLGVRAVVENLNGFLGDLGKMNAGVQDVGGQFANIGMKLAGGAIAGGLAAVAGGFATIAGASKLGLDSVTDWGEQLDKFSDMFGTTGEDASKWTVAMNRVGLTVDEGGQGLNFFTKNLDNVKTALELGDKAASPFQQALDKMGISAFDSTGAVRSLDDLMPEIMDKFQAMPAGIDASALAMDLFGARGGTKFLDFLRQGSQGLSDADAMAKAFGLSMSTEGVNAVEEYGFSLNELGLGFTGIKNQIGEAVLPYAKKFVDFLIQNVPTIVDWGKKLGEWIGGGLQIIIDLIGKFQTGGFSGLMTALGLTPEAQTSVMAFVNSIAALAGVIQQKLTEAFQWVSANALPLLQQGLNWLANVGLPAISQAIQFVIDNWDAFKGAIIGVLIGGGVLAAIAIVGGVIAALTSPIGLVVAACALLGAAWATNFLGIRDALTAFWYQTAQPALQQLWQWLQINIPIAIQILTTFWNGTLLPAFQTAGVFITGTVIPALAQVWTWLSTNIPAAIATVSGFWNGTLLPAIQSVSNFITGTLVPTFMDISTWLSSTISGAIQTVSALWTGTLQPALASVWAFIQNSILPVFAAVGNVLDAIVGLAVRVLAGLWQNVLQPALAIVWTYIQNSILPIFQGVSSELNTGVGNAVTIFSDLWKNTLLPAITLVHDFIQDSIVPIFTVLADTVNTVIGPPLMWLQNTVIAGLQSGLDGIKGALDIVTNGLNDMAEKINSIQLPDFLKTGSPTPFETGLRGIADTLQGKLAKAMETFSGTAPAAFKQLADTVSQIKADLSDMAENTLTAFGEAMTSAGTAMADTFAEGVSAIENLADALSDASGDLDGIAGDARSAAGAFDDFGDAANGIYSDLIPALQQLESELNDVAAAAAAAASHIGDIPSGGAGFAGGAGFQAGGSFIVPPGYPRDTFPMRVSTGERVIVIPKTQMAGGMNVTVSFGDVAINNGMDLAELGMFVERSVVQALGA